MSDPIQIYLHRVRRILASSSGYVATVLVGSLASDDFAPDHSDVDLIALFRTPLGRTDQERLSSALVHGALPCPAHGLDLIAYSLPAVQEPSPDLRYDFSLSSGPAWEDDISFGGPYPGGLIDLAAAREFGVTLEGIPVESLVGRVGSPWVRRELAEVLRWHRHKIHDPFHDPLGTNAVLNACRALHFLHSGSLTSKSRGARDFLSGPDAHLVDCALRARRSPGPRPLPREEVVAFLERALAEFASPGG